MIETTGVTLTYGTHDALRDVRLALPGTGLTVIAGHSGCGKSSLLSVVSGLRRPTNGLVTLDGRALASYRATELRSEVFSFVFQSHYLLMHLTAFENALAGLPRIDRDGCVRATRLFERLGLLRVAESRTRVLSGGERQRVAVARALLHPFRYLLADEPTAALDRASARAVYALLREAAATRAVLLVSHDAEALSLADRVIELRDGTVVADQRRAAAA